MKILEKTELSQFTTLKIGGEADKVCLPTNTSELIQSIDIATSLNSPWGIVGGGSNILISSNRIPGTVICTTGLNWIEVIGPNLIEAGSGVRLPRLSAYASKLSLSGMEFLEGIPGTVGGAVIMNAGAHGSSTNQVVEAITILNLKKGVVQTLTPSQVTFGYRHSSLDPNETIVLSARFRLTPDTEEAIRSRMKEYSIARRTSQPIKAASAGCTFSNPIEFNMSAGKLLDSLGAKDLQVGSAKVSTIHANFIVNSGNANSHDVCKLISRLQDEALNRHNILLKPEIKPLGVFDKSEAIIWTNADQTESNSFIITKK